MGVMDGLQFIPAFKSMEFPLKNKVTPVILNSAVDDDHQRTKDLGIDHYISKPLTEMDVNNLLG
jgi:CheY-like chemotaxis protein